MGDGTRIGCVVLQLPSQVPGAIVAACVTAPTTTSTTITTITTAIPVTTAATEPACLSAAVAAQTGPRRAYALWHVRRLCRRGKSIQECCRGGGCMQGAIL